MLFAFNDDKHGTELWQTDGYNNTELFIDFTPFGKNISDETGYYSNSSEFSFLEPFNGYYYISKINELWRTNGTTSQMWQVFDQPIRYISAMPDKLICLVGNKLYKSNGLTIDLVMEIPDMRPPLSPGYGFVDRFIEMNGIFYFLFSTNAYGHELWRTDGTASGTFMVKDLVPGPSGSNYDKICRVGNKLFFVSYTETENSELYVSDGTAEGTFMVKDIVPGENTSYPTLLTNFNDKLLIFNAYDNVVGQRLWKSDGTAEGTVVIEGPIALNPHTTNGPLYTKEMFTVHNKKVFFTAFDNTQNNFYSSDGSTITLIKPNFLAETIFVFNNELYIGAYTENLGFELWKSDGTEAGTTLVKDIRPGQSSSKAINAWYYNFVEHNNVLYFSAVDDTENYRMRMWVLRVPCADNLHFVSNKSGELVHKASKTIVGETANTILSTANVTYDAGKSILLKPGFSTNLGAVFQSKIGGCTSPQNESTSLSSITQAIDARTEQYLNDMREAPTMDDFMKFGKNRDLVKIWTNFKNDRRILRAKEQKLEQDLKNFEVSAPSSNTNRSVLNDYQTSKAHKQQAYQEAKQEAGQYGYIIVPVRDKENKKLGYDLTIYAAGKMHQSAIRY